MSTYVYGFTHAQHSLPIEGLVGVGEHAPPLRLVREGDLTAIVSDAPAVLRPKRRDLTRHEQVLARLCAAGTVLPMSFGMVARDEEMVRRELRLGARRYSENLSKLEGHAELNVKGAHAEDAILRDLLMSSPALREHNEALRAAGGGSHQDKLEFGERVAAAVAQRRARDAALVQAKLWPHAAQMRTGPKIEGCFVNVSYLVAVRHRADFEDALSKLREALNGYATLHMFGPLPPYSFVGEAAST